MPMKAFEVWVNNLEEAALLLDTLANYDQFQYDNNIKPDYCNAGGLMIWDNEDENGICWIDWYDVLTGEEFDEWRANNAVSNEK